MKVFVSGGAGFIGSHLCDFYAARGDEVWCLDNLATGRKENIGRLIGRPGFTFLEQDLLACDLPSLGVPFDLVFHLASPASPPDYFRLPVETLRVNSLGTERCLQLARRLGARLLFTSTSEVYGDPEIPVQHEGYWGHVNSIGPRSVYDEGKRYGEAVVMAYHRTFGTDTRLVRIFNTYGPRMRLDDGRVVPNFIGQALAGRPLTVYGDGRQTRSFCYVDDLVRGLTRMMEVDYHLPVNLGNPGEFTVLDLAEKVQAIVGRRTRIEYGPALEDDPRRRKPDIARARELLGWEPEVPLEAGLKKTIDYFRERAEQ